MRHRKYFPFTGVQTNRRHIAAGGNLLRASQMTEGNGIGDSWLVAAYKL